MSLFNSTKEIDDLQQVDNHKAGGIVMTRLTATKKREPELFKGMDVQDENEYFIKVQKEGDFTAAANKLGKLEDIEEKLGIDLITLFRASTDGFYGKDMHGEVYHFTPNVDCKTITLDFKYQRIEVRYAYDLKKPVSYTFGSCGTIWALTKEEVE